MDVIGDRIFSDKEIRHTPSIIVAVRTCFKRVQFYMHYVYYFTELVQTEDEMIWKFYESGTLSMELLKDDQLHKVYYRCKDKVIVFIAMSMKLSRD